MKSPFLQPRFDGARFEEHTLPLEVISDLSAYQELVIELAKHLYLNENPDRQRVPKGFGKDFHLHIEKIDDGCARPLLTLVTTAMLLQPVGHLEYFEKSKDLISECISSDVIPEDFPTNLLGYFNRLGRSLRGDEKLEFPVENSVSATLTPERRKSLVLASGKLFEKEVEITGFVEEADWKNSTCRIRLNDGTKQSIPMPTDFHETVRKVGGKERYQVTVQGVATFDSKDRLQNMISINFLEVQKNYELNKCFEDLANLEDGWYDGQGVAIDQKALEWISALLIETYPEDLRLPLVVPTPEGNLLFEWEVDGDPSIDIELVTKKAYFHAFGEDGEDIEEEFDLEINESWNGLYSSLSKFVKV